MASVWSLLRTPRSYEVRVRVMLSCRSRLVMGRVLALACGVGVSAAAAAAVDAHSRWTVTRGWMMNEMGIVQPIRTRFYGCYGCPSRGSADTISHQCEPNVALSQCYWTRCLDDGGGGGCGWWVRMHSFTVGFGRNYASYVHRKRRERDQMEM